MCKANIDVVFAVEASQAEFGPSVTFVRNVVRNFDIGPNDTRVGLVTYGNRVVLDFGLDRHTSLADVETALSNVSFIGGSTSMVKEAIETMVTQGFKLTIPPTPTTQPTTTVSANQQSTGVRLRPRVGVTIIDTKANSGSPRDAALAAKNLGITMFAIGLDLPAISEVVASDPVGSHVLELSTQHRFGDLANYVPVLLGPRLCQGKPCGSS